MFTVLSNTRNFNLYLIAALAIMMVVLLTFAVAPAISAPKPILVPGIGISEAASDYYQRHPELRVSAAGIADVTADFYLRHPEWASNVQNAVIPVTGLTEASDYYERHPELSAPAATVVDLQGDFFLRHPELSLSIARTADTNDYFTRHPELRPSAESEDLSDYFLRH